MGFFGIFFVLVEVLCFELIWKVDFRCLGQVFVDCLDCVMSDVVYVQFEVICVQVFEVKFLMMSCGFEYCLRFFFLGECF